MKRVNFVVGDTTVTLRFSDDNDPAKAKEWVDVKVPLNALKSAARKPGMFEQADIDWSFKKAPQPQPFGALKGQSLEAVEAAALRYVKAFIEQRIKDLES